MKCLENIYGLKGYAITDKGELWSEKSNRFLKKCTTNSGYYFVTLTKDGWSKPYLIHRLVASAYLGVDLDEVVNHKDGNKLNNSVSNLEWCTYKENTKHAYDTGLRNREVVNSYRSIDNDTCHKICAMLEEGARNKDICSALNLKPTAVSNIKAGKDYRDISCEYNFRKIPSSNRIAESKVIAICNSLCEGLSISKIIKKYNTCYTTVRSIKDRKAYTYLTKGFEW